MRIDICKCDHCQNDCPEIRSSSYFLPASKGLTIALKAGSSQGAIYRDFCSEECLRDYLVAHIKPKVEEKSA